MAFADRPTLAQLIAGDVQVHQDVQRRQVKEACWLSASFRVCNVGSRRLKPLSRLAVRSSLIMLVNRQGRLDRRCPDPEDGDLADLRRGLHGYVSAVLAGWRLIEPFSA